MKEIILKIRNRRLKGNVSLLVIFILLASSVIALLSINQIQHLLTYWNMTFNYFRAFYLAKAWTELWLTEVYYREAGFQQEIGTWDAVVTENLVWAYSWFNPYFTMNISWNFLYLTDDVRYTDKCDNGNRITLWAWEWIVLSLFMDKTHDINKILTWTNKNNIYKFGEFDVEKIEMTNVSWSWIVDEHQKKLTFWLFDYDDDWNMENIFVDQIALENLGNFLKKIYYFDTSKNRRYLSIKNHLKWDEVVSFCITNSDKKLVPYADSLITVRGNYADMEVGLQSVVKRQSPSWSLNVLDL
jgi:hypothetical protein